MGSRQSLPSWFVLAVLKNFLSRSDTVLGDIENTLIELVKAGAGDHGHGGGLLGFAKSVLTAASGGKKFSKDDVKRVYFVSHDVPPSRYDHAHIVQGNWLRDYSQVLELA
jgi:hypothetical protein